MGESSPLSSITQGDQQMEAAASEKLDLLKSKDAVLMRKIADQADEQLADATGYSLTDLGIDPLTFVEWMLVDFDYKLDGAYDNGDGTGTIELAVHGIDQDGTLVLDNVRYYNIAKKN